jgi:hypothetical protein
MLHRHRDRHHHRAKAVRAGAAVLITGLVAVIGVMGGHPAARATARRAPLIIRHVRELTPGLTWTRIRERGPERVNVLTVDPATTMTLDVAMPTEVLAGYQRVNDIATANGAIAAINGDFSVSPGRPIHAYAEDGDLRQTPLQQGPVFAASQDEMQTNIAPPTVGITATIAPAGTQFTVARWNTGRPQAGQIAGYSADGAGVSDPPAGGCAVRLIETGGPIWDAAGTGVARQYTVQESVCGATEPMPLDGGIVLWAQKHTLEAGTLESLLPATAVSIDWSLGWTHVLDAIGGMPVLVQNGMVAPNLRMCWSAAFCGPNPRSAIGVTADGHILLATVDGRHRKWSAGMTMLRWAQTMKRLGAVYALNLDGGGSTTMVVNGKVVNRPSDEYGPRGVSSAILVLPGPDAGDPPMDGSVFPPVPPPTPPPAGMGPDSAAASWGLTIADPASTGGLLDYLARGAKLGRSAPLPNSLADLLQQFRAATGR